MYISASRQRDSVVVWEQRNASGDHRIKRYKAIYDCYIKVDDWKDCLRKLKLGISENIIDQNLVEFITLSKDYIDRSTVHESMYADPLYKLEFEDGNTWKRWLASKPTNINLWESDIPPELKVLARHYRNATLPEVRTTFYDIEVDYQPKKYDAAHPIRIREGSKESQTTIGNLRSTWQHFTGEMYDEDQKKWVSDIHTTNYLYDGPIGFSSTVDPYAPINSISFYHVWKDEYIAFAVPPKTWRGLDPYAELEKQKELFSDFLSPHSIKFCSSEAELLMLSIEQIQACDLLSGYNSSLFDDPYFAQRVERVLGAEWFRMLSFPNGKSPYYQEMEIMFRPQKKVSFDGRVQLDYLELFKKFTVEDRDSWNLESVSSDHLGERFKKLDYEGTLNELYNNNFLKFVRYNFRDSEVLCELDKKYKFIRTANSLIHQSTCHFKNIVGTVRTADMAITTFCWYELNQRVPDSRILDEQGQAAGAYVLVPQTGNQLWIACFDINSLYPNTLRTINGSPETLRGQFIDYEQAWSAVFYRKPIQLTIKWERTGQMETRLAVEWGNYLVEHKMSISGYGTVFDQTKPGIIPTILGNWYADRKVNQKLAKEKEAELTPLRKQWENQPTEQLKQQITQLESEYQYYDMLQYCLKIKLNSLYGALLNQSFRFYDKRLGQSTTASGRVILGHQIRKGCEIIDGDYNIDPIVDDEDPRAIRGEIASPTLLYGDTDSGHASTLLVTSNGNKTMEQTFLEGVVYSTENDKEYCRVQDDFKVLTYHNEHQVPYYGEVEFIYRHKVSKARWRVTDEFGNSVTITGDHSIMVERNGTLIEAKPSQILPDDILITVK